VVPTQAFLDAVAAAIEAATTTLSPVALIEAVLFKAPFVPGPGLLIGGLTVADFDGYAPLAVDATGAQLFKDPSTGEWILQLEEPAGGWHWQTTGLTSLPQTIYGYGITDSTGAVLHGTALLDTPVVLSAVAQGVDIGQVRFRLGSNALT